MYEMICASAQGANHIKRGLVCEDYGQVFESDSCKIFALADGHGDSNAPRSQFGAQKACEIAISELESFCVSIAENAWESSILEMGKRFEKLSRQLISSIVAKWNLTVNADFEANPLTQTEREGCTRHLEKYDRGEYIEHIYGTTLIAGLLTDTYLLLLQQGDGQCAVFSANGDVSQPIPWDDHCFAQFTTSLCEEDAIQRCRFFAVDMKKTPVVACMAGSDGVDDSFPNMNHMHAYYRDLLIYACEHGAEAVNAHLTETLPELSRTGSGDDATICGFIDIEKITSLIPAFRQHNEMVVLETKIADISQRLQSINGMGKMDALRERYTTACQNIEAAQAEVEATQAAFDAYNDDVMQLYKDEAENTEKFNRWNRIIEAIYPGSRTMAIQKKAEALDEAKALAEQNAQQVFEALKPIETEYYAYIARKEAYENDLAEAQTALENLRSMPGPSPASGETGP